MKRLVSALMALFICISLCACGSEDDSVIKATKDSSGKFSVIKTPYADLSLPVSVAKNMEFKLDGEAPYKVTFYSKKDKTKLYSILFGGQGDLLLGTIPGEIENTVLYVDISKLDEASENFESNAALQESINNIIEKLVSDYDFVVNETVISQNNETFDIKTSVVTLKYPLKWKNKVDIKATDKKVEFSYYKTKLFDLVFSPGEGYLLGTYKETPIYVINYPVTTDEQSAMQEDVNVILENLLKDKNFVINKE